MTKDDFVHRLNVAVLLTTFLGAGFIAGTACASFQPGTKDVCTFVDSRNPIVGAMCLTLEELESAFSHVKATRMTPIRAHLAYGEKLDICKASLNVIPELGYDADDASVHSKGQK